MTSPSVQSGQRPASIYAAVALLALSAVAVLAGALLEDSGNFGGSALPVVVRVILAVAIWRGYRSGWAWAVGLSVVWTVLTGVALAVLDPVTGGSAAYAGVEIALSVLLLVALLLPSSRAYCTRKSDRKAKSGR
jgi:uncharacterized membrane protein